ncbi:TolC family protein [Bdellovibrio sp. ZAP7]|uniref:TolC family protein n=1 Tax=Bdellovibrio sp. ZAP7 TaxID=2231053 RepID=UPI00115B057C|nr:TolC family protein [Bdellovibrio sp. ZAP7]QDK44639.1 TolC family protein [Bdellovibrio sp. ZAP7]
MRVTSLLIFTQFILVFISAFAKEGSTLASLEAQMLSSNPQIRSLEATVKAQKATAQSQFGNFLPQISLNGGYAENKTIQEPSEGYLGYVSGRWNLYRGGEDSSLRTISNSEFQIAQLDLDVKTRALRRQLRETYYSLLANKKNLSILDEKSDFLNKQRQMAQKKINAGLTSNVDSIEIDLEENNILNERESIKAEIERLNKELSTLTGLNISESSVSDRESFDINSIEINIETALQNNPSLKKQDQLEEISHAKVTQQRSEFLPFLDLEASYGRITPEYSDPLNGTESRFALLLSWNLFSGFSSYYRHQATNYGVSTQQFDKKNTRLEIEKDLRNLLTTRESLAKLKIHQQQRLMFAQKYYEMTLSEYKRGIKNSPDLQTATVSLFEAKRRMIELERDITIVNAKITELI